MLKLMAPIMLWAGLASAEPRARAAPGGADHHGVRWMGAADVRRAFAYSLLRSVNFSSARTRKPRLP